jgi:hypothetical protein
VHLLQGKAAMREDTSLMLVVWVAPHFKMGHGWVTVTCKALGRFPAKKVKK